VVQRGTAEERVGVDRILILMSRIHRQEEVAGQEAWETTGLKVAQDRLVTFGVEELGWREGYNFAKYFTGSDGPEYTKIRGRSGPTTTECD